MFQLPDLPYAYDALEPTISAETMHLHHDKHHAAYVKAANDLVGEHGLAPDSLEALITLARGDGPAKLFNSAAQAWNHAFFWDCMNPKPGAPSAELTAAIDKAFGGPDGLKAAFLAQGAGHFGSGWVWLAAGPSGLEVVTTHDGENLLGAKGLTPVFTCDLWEHAYYVDYRNDRKAFLQAWFDKALDWGFASRQYAAAHGQGATWRYPAPEVEAARRQA